MGARSNNPEEGSGPGKVDPGMLRRALLCREAVEFFEKMTKATKQGWPDISGEDFLAGLAQSIHSWLLTRSDGWTLRQLLMQQLVENCRKPRAISKSALKVHESAGTAAKRPLRESVYRAMVKEFERFLMALQKDDLEAANEVAAHLIVRMLSDSVVAYGCKRNNGIGYSQTLQYNLLDLA
jgi:hypothetical protein